MKKPLIIACLGMIVLSILFFAINPAGVPAFILVLPFILLFIILMSLFLYIFELKKGIETKKSIKLAALCASLPILLLVLQSIGQLTIRDTTTVSILFLLSYFYIARSTTSP